MDGQMGQTSTPQTSRTTIRAQYTLYRSGVLKTFIGCFNAVFAEKLMVSLAGMSASLLRSLAGMSASLLRSLVGMSASLLRSLAGMSASCATVASQYEC